MVDRGRSNHVKLPQRCLENGAEPWLDDTDLEGGDEILERIRHGIDRCDEAIVLLSPESIKSPWVIF